MGCYQSSSVSKGNINLKSQETASFTASLSDLEKVPIKEFSLPIKKTIYESIMKLPRPHSLVEFIRCLPSYYTANHLNSLQLSPNNQTSITTIHSPFNYPPTPTSDTHWYMNFADTHLFGYYHSKLYAQDEQQCTEIPHLIHVREYAKTQSNDNPDIIPITIENKNPTPVLVKNVPRLCSIDILPSDEHPSGFYGNNFEKITFSILQQRMNLFNANPIFTNIIAMAALGYQQGVYTNDQVEFTLNTAIISFNEAKKQSNNSRCIIHTSNWGCGAFGNNRTLIALIQIYAAKITGVNGLVYHLIGADDKNHVETAINTLDQLSSRTITQKEFIKYIHSQRFEWGQSNGT